MPQASLSAHTCTVGSFRSVGFAAFLLRGLADHPRRAFQVRGAVMMQRTTTRVDRVSAGGVSSAETTLRQCVFVQTVVVWQPLSYRRNTLAARAAPEHAIVAGDGTDTGGDIAQ